MTSYRPVNSSSPPSWADRADATPPGDHQYLKIAACTWLGIHARSRTCTRPTLEGLDGGQVGIALPEQGQKAIDTGEKEQMVIADLHSRLKPVVEQVECHHGEQPRLASTTHLRWHTQCTNGCVDRELTKEDVMASPKQQRTARRNIKKAAAAAKRKHTLRNLSKRTRRAMGKEGAKARAAGH